MKIQTKFLTKTVIALALSQSISATQAQTIQFSGYAWATRTAQREGPGPNDWDSRNAFVDKHGWLHLKIAKRDGKWQCAEVFLTKNLGFGRYEWEIQGKVDTLDPNVVLGLFNYPTPQIGTDGTNEIDIEFAHWGNAKWNNGNYTIYPSSGKRVETEGSETFPLTLTGNISTHAFFWTRKLVAFKSLDNKPNKTLKRWLFAPKDTRLVPQTPLPVHMNVWLFGGKPPTNGKSVEIVIKRFTFTPTK